MLRRAAIRSRITPSSRQPSRRPSSRPVRPRMSPTSTPRCPRSPRRSRSRQRMRPTRGSSRRPRTSRRRPIRRPTGPRRSRLHPRSFRKPSRPPKSMASRPLPSIRSLVLCPWSVVRKRTARAVPRCQALKEGQRGQTERTPNNGQRTTDNGQHGSSPGASPPGPGSGGPAARPRGAPCGAAPGPLLPVEAPGSDGSEQATPAAPTGGRNTSGAPGGRDLRRRRKVGLACRCQPTGPGLSRHPGGLSPFQGTDSSGPDRAHRGETARRNRPLGAQDPVSTRTPRQMATQERLAPLRCTTAHPVCYRPPPRPHPHHRGIHRRARHDSLHDRRLISCQTHGTPRCVGVSSGLVRPAPCS
jgi:hypothetical protein